MQRAGGNHRLAPWVLVCGGFHRFGGMDCANLALAETLLEQGREVFLVAHHIEPQLLSHPRVHATIIPRPLNSILLGERTLRRMGVAKAADVVRQWPNARVVVNGGNCDWGDINWVHVVHTAWPRFDQGAPLWFRAKSALNKWKARRDERRALERAKLVIANSARTRNDLLNIGIPANKIRTVYLGSDSEWKRATEEERSSARAEFNIPPDAIVVGFVGALGYDRNKGFDTLLGAWSKLQNPNTYLLVAGGGRGLARWQHRVQGLSHSDRVRMVGFTQRVSSIYTASDVIVSPVRYEAFGLNVQEAICRGVPAIVSASAGVAELYPEELRRYLLSDPGNSDLLCEVLQFTVSDLQRSKEAFSGLQETLRGRTWKQMAEEIIALAELTAVAPQAHD